MLTDTALKNLKPKGKPSPEKATFPTFNPGA